MLQSLSKQRIGAIIAKNRSAPIP